jgi:putative tricarboxylic transport membrane protein
MINLTFQGYLNVITPMNILLILAGTAFGIICGALPGISGTMAVVIGLTATYSMNKYSAFAFLMALYIGGQSGGLVSAILLGIPGTGASIATTFDGYPMTKKGQGGKALGMAILVSFFGTILSILALEFIAPAVANIAVQFGPVEMFSVVLFALTLVTLLAGKNLLKGLIAMFIGLSLAMVGTTPVDGIARYTFGFTQLRTGLAITPIVVGMFALPSVMTAGEKTTKFAVNNIKITGLGVNLSEFVGQIKNMIVAGLIGIGIGILPGIGGTTSGLMAYGAVKGISKHPEKFGTGYIDGIVATETANNATIGGAMVPLLTLGIPGDGVTAILLGAMTILGLQPGPLLFTNSADLVYSIFASMTLASFAMLAIMFICLKYIIRLLNLPQNILMPIIMTLCVIGAFSNNSRVFEIYIFLIAGIIGKCIDMLKYPQAPILLGFLLGGYTEKYLRRGLQMTDGSFIAFFSYPIAAVFIVLSIVFLVFNIWRRVRSQSK